MKLPIIPLFCLLGLVLAVGCQKSNSNLPATVKAEGVVTLDGKPVEGASVTFIADQGNYHAKAITDASGKFRLRAFDEKEGAVPGSYKVQVNKTVVSNSGGGDSEASVNVQYGLPAKYSTMAESGLTSTIPEAGTTDIKLELVSK